MTAARDYIPTPSPTRYRPRQKTIATRHLRSVAPKTLAPKPSQPRAKVTPLPTQPKRLPLALEFLLLLQKSSTTITCGLVAITLGVYGWTVYAPTQWSQEFSKLKTLQRNERQLAATNESLKHKMAQQAEQPGSGLTSPKPHKSIFLTPAEVSIMEVKDPLPNPEGKSIVLDTPIAY
ncbi:hypothetical protein [Crocosphaera sp. Alani8]|uniref:hypothetical protein n=1 Tax=Crocosphaera sp. Alani8 TaxID=3038952 RepID=UPI00313CF0FF